jgi:SepF-like predicted cell division protein (DUF552 family)
MAKKPFKKYKGEHVVAEVDKYIDLGEMTFDEAVTSAPGGMSVKVAELHRYEDLSDLTRLVYNGNILILDFTPIANDSLTLRRVTNELRSVTRDVGGDLAGINKNFLIITPEGIVVDRTKIKGPY